jgi:replicative DNA helicase
MNIDNNTANTNFIEEVEEKLLSIFLSDHNSAVKGNAFLTPKDFSKPQNTAIFNAIKDLVENNKTVDALTTKSYFDAHPNIQFVDFSKYITKLTMQFSSIAGLDEYIEIVKDASIKRNLDKVCHDIIESKFSFTNFDKEISKKINAFNDIA